MKLPQPLLDLTPVMRGLATAYTVSGVTHLVRPSVFQPIVPRELPRPRDLVYASGVVELACAAGLVTPRYRRVAGAVSAAMLVAFVPAHVEMTRQALEKIQAKGSTPGRQAYFAGTLVRIAGQVPLITGSVAVARGGRG